MSNDPSGDASGTMYELVGGRPFFDRLVGHFYLGVEQDQLLRPLYPPDLTDSRAHLAGFLAQYWGGGAEHYSAERGHPRLRMRHAGFVVGVPEREAWMRHMKSAVEAEGLPSELEGRLLDYFALAATHLING